MKKAPLILLTPLLLGSSLSSAPLVSIGDNIDAFFNLQTGVRSDSNVTAAPTGELDDVVFTIRPGVEFDFIRGESVADAQLVVQSTILRYSDNDVFDAENLGVFGSASYDDVVYAVSGNFSYVEDQRTTQRIDLDGLIETETTRAGASLRYNFSEKLGVRASAEIVSLDYVGVFEDLLPDRETYTLPVKFFYSYSPKLDLTAGFRYRNADIDDENGIVGTDPEDFQLTLGVEGELLPKLVGIVDLGYQNRDFQEGDRDSVDTLTVAAELLYSFSPKVGMGIAASRDFDSIADGNTIETSTLDLSLNYAYNSFWSSSAFLSLSLDDFKATGREDESVTVGIAGQYSPNGYLTLGGSFSYTDLDSNEPRDFDKTVVEFTASLRY